MEKKNCFRTTEDLRYITRNVEDVNRFSFKKGDILLVSYPKSGTHWMKFIIWGILYKGEAPPNINNMKYGCLFPQIELCGTKIVERMKSPRTFNSHLTSELLPYCKEVKYIHVTRNPFDSCVSYYRYRVKRFPENYGDLTLDQFFDDFLTGDVAFGDYFQHVLGWYQHKGEENYLHITYEDMKKDHRGSILKVAKYLGEDYYRDIANDDELLRKIEYHSSYSFMESLPKSRAPMPGVLIENIEWGQEDAAANDKKFREFNFFFGGQVGRFKKTLSEEQKQRMRKKMVEQFRDTDLVHQWDGVLRDC